MNTSKTLLAILVKELPKRGGWPADASRIVQDGDGEAKSVATCADVEFPNVVGIWYRSGGNTAAIGILPLADDWQVAIITREQYEAALAEKEHPLPWDEKSKPCPTLGAECRGCPDCGRRVSCTSDDITDDAVRAEMGMNSRAMDAALAAKNDGWIEWRGGECPVPEGTLVDVRYRDGQELNALPANDIAASSRDASHAFWRADGNQNDIIAYRLHQPQDANSRANDDRLEADLNECIGQAPGAPQWDGHGLPPVGVEFEYGSHRSRAKCMAVGLHYVFASKGDPHDAERDYEECMIDIHTSFHLARSADEIKRDAEIAALADDIDDSDEGSVLSSRQQDDIAKHLYAAGYRKQ